MNIEVFHQQALHLYSRPLVAYYQPHLNFSSSESLSSPCSDNAIYSFHLSAQGCSDVIPSPFFTAKSAKEKFQSTLSGSRKVQQVNLGSFERRYQPNTLMLQISIRYNQISGDFGLSEVRTNIIQVLLQLS
jgi:hypothetical protein